MSSLDLQERIKKLKTFSLTNPSLNTHTIPKEELTMETKTRLHDFVVDGVKLNVMYTEHDDETWSLKANCFGNIIPLLSESQVSRIIQAVKNVQQQEINSQNTTG